MFFHLLAVKHLQLTPNYHVFSCENTPLQTYPFQLYSFVFPVVHMTGCCCFSLLWTKENMYNHCQAVCCNSPCRHRGLPVKNEQPEQDNSSHSFHSSSLFFFWFSCLLGKENSFQERPRLSGHRRSVNQCVYMVCVCVCVCLQTFLFPMPEVQRDKTPPLLSFPGLRII